MQWYKFSQDAVEPCFMADLDSCDIFTNILQGWSNSKGYGLYIAVTKT